MLAKRAVKILYNIASMECVKYSPYAPKLTPEQRACKIKIIQWGAFVCLLHVCLKSEVKGINQFCENALLKYQLMSTEIEAIIDSLKGFQENKLNIQDRLEAIPTEKSFLNINQDSEKIRKFAASSISPYSNPQFLQRKIASTVKISKNLVDFPE